MIKYLAIAALAGATIGNATPARAANAYLFTVVTKAEEATVRVTDPKNAKNTSAIKVKANSSNVLYVEKAPSYTVEITVCGKVTPVKDIEAKLTSMTVTVRSCTGFSFEAK